MRKSGRQDMKKEQVTIHRISISRISRDEHLSFMNDELLATKTAKNYILSNGSRVNIQDMGKVCSKYHDSPSFFCFVAYCLPGEIKDTEQKLMTYVTELQNLYMKTAMSNLFNLADQEGKSFPIHKEFKNNIIVTPEQV